MTHNTYIPSIYKNISPKEYKFFMKKSEECGVYYDDTWEDMERDYREEITLNDLILQTYRSMMHNTFGKKTRFPLKFRTKAKSKRNYTLIINGVRLATMIADKYDSSIVFHNKVAEEFYHKYIKDHVR